MKYSEINMDIRHTLADNLRILMDKRPDLNTQIKIHKATELTQSTVQRVLSAQVDVTLGTLQRLAQVFSTTPAKLITPKDHVANNAVVESSEFALNLADLFDSLPTEPTLRAQAYTACQVALSVIAQQHGQQMPAPNSTVTLKKVRE